MTQIWDCTDARPSLGVYVLGAIDPAERALVDAHLLTCRDCRDELAGLAGLPALLARVNPDEISRITSEDTVRDGRRRPAAGRADRHGARPGRGQAAPDQVALCGGGRGRRGHRRRPVRRAELDHDHADRRDPGLARGHPLGNRRGDERVTGASASVAYSHEMWGDAFEVLVDHIPVGTTCQLWVVHPNGTRTQVAAWTTAGDEGNVWYAGSMPSTAQPISSFQITADKKVLLTARPT